MPAALMLWAGCVCGLLTSPFPEVALCAAALAAAAVRLLPPRARAGLLASAALLVVGTGLARLDVHRANTDPAMIAAGRGAYVSLEITVTANAVPLPAAFGPGSVELGAGSVEQDTGGPPDTRNTRPQRIRLAAESTLVEVAGQASTSHVAVSVVAAGPDWATIPVGTRLRVGGLLAVDEFPVVPGVQLRARTQPTVVEPGPWWYRVTGAVRSGLHRSAQTLAPDPAGLLPGLVVGDTSGIGEKLSADAKTTGLTHLLAVSGSHFAILCGLVVLALRGFGPRVAVGGGALTLVGLVLLVGPQPSVLRAAVMGAVGLLAVLAGRVRTAVPALATAVIVLLLAEPALALSAGFVLSVLATGGLVFLAPPWAAALRRRGIPRGWADFVCIPVAAQITTLPVVAALSDQVSLASLPANLAVAPVVPVALVIGVLCAVLGPWWPSGGNALAQVDEPLLSWISGTAHLLARQAGAAVPWPGTGPGVLVLAGLLISGLLLLRHRRIRALALAALTGGFAVLLPSRMIALPGWPAPGWLLTACDVGQGDAMVLATDEPGVAVVVDTGPEPALVDRCLDRLGIGTIPLLVLTHLHADHIDGLAGALGGRSVGAIGVGPEVDLGSALAQVRRTAQQYDVPVVALPLGTRWSSDGLSLQVLGPRQLFHGTDSDPNNDSVVMMAQRAGIRMLMTGDVETEAQQQLLNARTDLAADVLKVPHHGSSKDLPSFLRAISPEVAVIGVGKDNDYGHPSPRTLDALWAVGTSAILRTDTEGDVEVSLVGGALAVTIRGP